MTSSPPRRAESDWTVLGFERELKEKERATLAFSTHKVEEFARPDLGPWKAQFDLYLERGLGATESVVAPRQGVSPSPIDVRSPRRMDSVRGIGMSYTAELRQEFDLSIVELPGAEHTCLELPEDVHSLA